MKKNKMVCIFAWRLSTIRDIIIFPSAKYSKIIKLQKKSKLQSEWRMLSGWCVLLEIFYKRDSISRIKAKYFAGHSSQSERIKNMIHSTNVLIR